MKGRKGRFLFTLFLTLLVFGFGTRIVRADETDNFQSDKKSIETAETKILEEEFDFKEIEKSLSELFPKEKISFSVRRAGGNVRIAYGIHKRRDSL